jgi:predicted RNA-binding protein with PIN domain
MRYLIDGHNLIPHISGLSLRQQDDEMRLLDLLQTFSREHRAQLEVFFDGAPPGWAGIRRFGSISAHFVQKGITADDAIRNRLDQIPNGSGLTVVSSDRQVQAEARNHRAEVISSRDFAGNFSVQKPVQQKRKKDAQSHLSEEEIDEWLQIFKEDDPFKDDS